MDTYDIVVAGNGALGLATARALTLVDPRLRIAVVGPSAVPRERPPQPGRCWAATVR
ncbi:hypothetical protein QEG98_29940 [Myxococcus sp. MxC21-1]|uniref:hypothetical protein n=1 Tax=Myxococcus sp. MxC21-1 TaxID=3041439 RepID=UPI00292DDAD1|nr:hypothetical protein [Myxococcus sp. MxC21-1]WNZ60200.1 hypothetical protein QEG98_29940 [Myxococcus sp. MxC21-1]